MVYVTFKVLIVEVNKTSVEQIRMAETLLVLNLVVWKEISFVFW